MTLGKAIVKESGTALSISCEDYNVAAFGGADYEFTYTFDMMNRTKLLDALQAEGVSGTTSEIIKKKFGEHLELCSVSAYCDQHGIKYAIYSHVL